MSYYHGRAGDWFQSLTGTGATLALTGLGTAIGGPIGGAVGALAGTIGGSFGSAMGELAHSDFAPFGGGKFASMVDSLRGMVSQGVFGGAVGGYNPLPSPALANNYGSFYTADTPFTRPGAPIDFDFSNPDTGPNIYESFTNMDPEEDAGMDWFDYGR